MKLQPDFHTPKKYYLHKKTTMNALKYITYMYMYKKLILLSIHIIYKNQETMKDF